MARAASPARPQAPTKGPAEAGPGRVSEGGRRKSAGLHKHRKGENQQKDRNNYDEKTRTLRQVRSLHQELGHDQATPENRNGPFRHLVIDPFTCWPSLADEAFSVTLEALARMNGLGDSGGRKPHANAPLETRLPALPSPPHWHDCRALSGFPVGKAGGAVIGHQTITRTCIGAALRRRVDDESREPNRGDDQTDAEVAAPHTTPPRAWGYHAISPGAIGRRP